MKKLVHIGTVELISLPDDAIEAIPAKVDTGADGSSIWASNIRVRSGELYFNFFAPGFAYYNETPVKTTAFRVTTVRNSFGQKESRYKIKLRVQVGDHTLKRWFTLANRSHNNYPILLGKNFLKNKFIVDVSQKNLVSKQLSDGPVLIFVKHLADNQEFFKEVGRQSLTKTTYQCLKYNDLIFSMEQDIKIINTKNKADLSDYSLTYFKDHHNHEFAFSVAEYLQYKGRPYFNKEFGHNMSSSKLSEYMRLACYKIKIPKTICAASPILKTMFTDLSTQLGLPFVLKEIRSDRGKHNYLIQNQKDFDKIFEAAPENHVYAAQQYIENDGFYRIYVMGKDVKLAVWRSAAAHQDRLKTHLNKPRGSANAKLVAVGDVPGEAHDLAVHAADCMDRQICGIDLVQDKKTKQWYVLEANNDPQIRSGSFVGDKSKMVAKFFDKELNH